MRKQTFYDWITQEILSARFSLIPLYETKDKLLYADAAALRNEYHEKIGKFEEPILEAELEVSLLQEKLRLIQIAVNRREKIDLESIEKALEEKRKSMLSEVEQQDKTLNELPQLSEEDQHTMQRIYRDIINNYHPGLNPNVTESQKELYEKAMEAYQHQNLEELKLVNEMLTTENSGGVELAFDFTEKEDAPGERRKAYNNLASSLSTDYLLAKKLYSCFAAQETDTVMWDSYDAYKAQRAELEKEIEEIKASFPFSAEDVLKSKEKTEEYLTELRIRQRKCEMEKRELEEKINKLTGVEACE